MRPNRERRPHHIHHRARTSQASVRLAVPEAAHLQGTVVLPLRLGQHDLHTETILDLLRCFNKLSPVSGEALGADPRIQGDAPRKKGVTMTKIYNKLTTPIINQ